MAVASSNSEPAEDALAMVETLDTAPVEEAEQQQEVAVRIADLPCRRMDGFIIPMVAQEARETLPTILDLIEQLQMADAPSHLIGYFAEGHFTQAHNTFHQASELEVGNYILALTAVLMAPHVATIHSNELKAGRFIEAWITLARTDTSLLATQQKFVRLAKIIHKLCQPMRQSPILYNLLNCCLDVLAQLAELGNATSKAPAASLLDCPRGSKSCPPRRAKSTKRSTSSGPAKHTEHVRCLPTLELEGLPLQHLPWWRTGSWRRSRKVRTRTNNRPLIRKSQELRPRPVRTAANRPRLGDRSRSRRHSRAFCDIGPEKQESTCRRMATSPSATYWQLRGSYLSEQRRGRLPLLCKTPTNSVLSSST